MKTKIEILLQSMSDFELYFFHYFKPQENPEELECGNETSEPCDSTKFNERIESLLTPEYKRSFAEIREKMSFEIPEKMNQKPKNKPIC